MMRMGAGGGVGTDRERRGLAEVATEPDPTDDGVLLPGRDDGVPGAVGAAVVHDDDRERQIGTGGEGGVDLLHELTDAVLLVVRRDHHGHVVETASGVAWRARRRQPSGEASEVYVARSTPLSSTRSSSTTATARYVSPGSWVQADPHEELR